MQKAKLSWTNGYPHSQEFDDIYFSEEGLNESSYVFLGLNQLEQKFRDVKQNFTVAELGFGTGLNFFLSWQLFLAKADKDKRLNFISVEKFPFSAEEFKLAWSNWPELKEYTSELLAKLPNNIPGTHRINLANNRICLTLIYADVTEALLKIGNAAVDCWFLDGFAPQKNPEMWSEQVLDNISKLSKAGTSLATFTAAGFVKRGLEQRGWKVEKVKGYGKKRESLKAEYQKQTDIFHSSPPWFSISKLKAQKTADVLIIGAGLAGCWTAYNFASKGLNVKLIDKNPKPAQAASGNVAALAIPYLSLENDLRHRFFLSAFDYARRELQKFKSELNFKESVIQNFSEQRSIAFNQSLEKLKIAPQIASYLDKRQFLYSQALRLSPPLLCEALINGAQASGLLSESSTNINSSSVSAQRSRETQDSPDKKIEFINYKQALKITKQDSDWQIQTACGHKFDSKIVVVCNSFDALGFKELDWLPLTQVRGELVLVEDKSPQELIDKPICGGVYIIPLEQQKYLIGASYDYVFLDPQPSQKIQQEIFEKAQKEFAIFSLQAKIIDSRVSFRAATYDRIPFVGAVPDIEFMLQEYANYRRGYNFEEYQDCEYLDGLYVNAGHGSRGLVSAPICAEIISSLVCSQPMPIEQDIFHSLMPNRWPIRQLARGHEVARQRSAKARFPAPLA